MGGGHLFEYYNLPLKSHEVGIFLLPHKPTFVRLIKVLNAKNNTNIFFKNLDAIKKGSLPGINTCKTIPIAALSLNVINLRKSTVQVVLKTRNAFLPVGLGRLKEK